MPVTTATIKSNGKVMNPGFELLSIDVTKEFNKVPLAELRLIDGDVAKQTFEVLDGDFFEPGKEIEIALRYEGETADEETIFVGMVVNQGLELNSTGMTVLVEMSDAAIKMTNLRKNAVYVNKKDSDIIRKLATDHKVEIGKIAETGLRHAEMVQYYSTDWDFMLSRAEANGQLIMANDGALSTVEPQIGKASMVLELGKDNIYDFDFQVSSLNQYQQVSTIGWDLSRKTLTNPNKGKDFAVEQGNISIPSVAKAMGTQQATFLSPVSLHPNELKAWADAQVVKSRLALLRGWIKIPGTAKAKVGQTLDIKGFSKRFTGRNIITGIRHQVTPSDWVTLIQIGMAPDWFMNQAKVVDSQAAGLLPGVNGLQLGVVVAHEQDPSNEFRLRVQIPAFDPQKGTVWARLASGDAGPERGILFRPEVGDEVVIGFLNDDPRQAIVLGSLYGSANKPPLPITAQNGEKGIITKKKYRLLFDEEKETLTLATSDKNRISIDEQKGVITISDGHGNQIEMSEKGISFDCAKDISLKTKGNFEVEAKGNVKIGGKKVDLI